MNEPLFDTRKNDKKRENEKKVYCSRAYIQFHLLRKIRKKESLHKIVTITFNVLTVSHRFYLYIYFNPNRLSIDLFLVPLNSLDWLGI